MAKRYNKKLLILSLVALIGFASIATIFSYIHSRAAEGGTGSSAGVPDNDKIKTNIDYIIDYSNNGDDPETENFIDDKYYIVEIGSGSQSSLEGFSAGDADNPSGFNRLVVTGNKTVAIQPNDMRNGSVDYKYYSLATLNTASGREAALKAIANADLIYLSIDPNNKFDAENGLRQALEYIYSLPDDSGVYNDGRIDVKPILTDPYARIDCFYADRTISQQGNKPVTLVGFPSENGNGVKLGKWSSMYGIMENADNKAGAWKFIEFFLSDEMQSYTDIVHGLPIMERAHKIWWDRAPEYQFSINSPVVESYDAPKNGEAANITITDAQKKQLDDYIHNMKIFFYEDEEVVDIIKEECDYVINGERTPDQCIDILNDRVGTYLAENG